MLRVAWLIHPGRPPEHNVRLSVEHGVVTDIGPVPPDEANQIEQAALLPMLVNAHTHLEFSGLNRPLPPPHPFPDWIRQVIRYRRTNLPDDESVDQAIQSGVQQTQAWGTGLIGEITTSAVGAAALHGAASTANSTVIAFRELIGFGQNRIQDQLQLAERHVQEFRRQSDKTLVLPGISPHAPYTVHPKVVEGVCQLARQWQFPVAMHLAETAAEIQLLSSRTGPFVDLLQSLDLWDANVLQGVKAPRDYLEWLARVPNSLAVHGNYLTDEDILFLQRHPQIAVVYCPRTHAWFGHPHHPWQRLRAGGATVILGTDSRASNPDLSIWAELQFLAANNPQSALWDLLPMITTTAAAALGQPAAQHSIEVGQPLRAIKVKCKCDSETRLHDYLIHAAFEPEQL